MTPVPLRHDISINLYSSNRSTAIEVKYHYLNIKVLTVIHSTTSRFSSLFNMPSDPNDESWKTAPPYREPEQENAQGGEFVRKIKGTCHCGNVKYWISVDKPLAAKYCHCHDCQVMHGEFPPWGVVGVCWLTGVNRRAVSMGCDYQKRAHGV